MSRRPKATGSQFAAAYNAMTLEFERHEALMLLLQTHLETFDGDKCGDTGIREEIFAASVLASVLHEQIQRIRDIGRVVWDAAKERGGAK